MSTDRIEKSIVLRAPLDRVWNAVSDAKQFGSWFGVAFDGPFKENTRLTGKIVPTTVDAPQRPLQPDVEAGSRESREAGENVALLRECTDDRIGKAIGRPRPAGFADLDPHELLRLADRQRPQQQRVDQREDRGRRADAERQGQHRGHAERGLLKHRAQRVTDVAPGLLEPDRCRHGHRTAPDFPRDSSNNRATRSARAAPRPVWRGPRNGLAAPSRNRAAGPGFGRRSATDL